MLATVETASLAVADLEALRDRGLDLEAKRRSSATRRVYTREIAAFEAWTTANGFEADPGNAASVYGYLSYLSTRKALATICKIAAALSSISQERGYLSPLKNGRVAGLLEGLRRETAAKGIQSDERAALPLDDLRLALATIDRDSLLGKRDACVLTLGFCGALRRSELVALDRADVNFVNEGATIMIRRSKTDQNAKGAVVAIPSGASAETCPVRALKEWIDASEITDGALLRSIDRHGNLGPSLGAQYIADTVKRAAKAAGLNVERLSAHSLRAGAATQAAKKGVTRESIKRLGRWKSDVYERYIRFETVWEDAPAARLGM